MIKRVLGARDTFTSDGCWLGSLELVPSLKWNLLLGYFFGVKFWDFLVIHLALWKTIKCIFINAYMETPTTDLHFLLSNNSVNYLYANNNYFHRWWSASIPQIFWYPRQGVVSQAKQCPPLLWHGHCQAGGVEDTFHREDVAWSTGGWQDSPSPRLLHLYGQRHASDAEHAICASTAPHSLLCTEVRTQSRIIKHAICASTTHFMLCKNSE